MLENFFTVYRMRSEIFLRKFRADQRIFKLSAIFLIWLGKNHQYVVKGIFTDQAYLNDPFPLQHIVCTIQLCDLIHFPRQQLQKSFFKLEPDDIRTMLFPLVVRPFSPSFFDEKVSQSDDTNVFHIKFHFSFRLEKNTMEEL